jgi:hypothetical protein
MCNVIESWMLGGGDEKSTPTNIWEGATNFGEREYVYS